MTIMDWILTAFVVIAFVILPLAMIGISIFIHGPEMIRWLRGLCEELGDGFRQAVEEWRELFRREDS